MMFSGGIRLFSKRNQRYATKFPDFVSDPKGVAVESVSRTEKKIVVTARVWPIKILVEDILRPLNTPPKPFQKIGQASCQSYDLLNWERRE